MERISLPIARIEQETSRIRTYWFDYALKAEPGQFVMLWIPGFDEKPISIAYADKKTFALTVSAVGPATQALSKFKVGDYLGITGPLGTYFKIPKHKQLVMVAGGYGVAPLYFASLKALQQGCTVDFLLGARSKNLLLYLKKFAKTKVHLHLATNDGSLGHQGIVTELLEKLCQKNKPYEIMTCGPELMEYRVLELAEKYKARCQISIERYMKCGVGICGSCAIDPLGLRMCQEGPVVDKILARMLTEFGHYKRDVSGAIHKF